MTRVCRCFQRYLSLSRALSYFHVHSFQSTLQRLCFRRYSPGSPGPPTTTTHPARWNFPLDIPSSTTASSSHLLSTSSSATPNLEVPTSHHSRPVTSLRVGNSKLPERSIRSATFDSAIHSVPPPTTSRSSSNSNNHNITTHLTDNITHTHTHTS